MKITELITNIVVASNLIPARLRPAILRKLGIKIGSKTAIASGTIFKSHNVNIGNDSFINHDCHFDRGHISIGNQVFVGPGVKFLSRDHEIGPSSQRAGANIDRPITVDDGCWIAANAIILGGVKIARGCIVGAGAVVTKDTKPDGVYVGVPARLVKTLPAD